METYLSYMLTERRSGRGGGLDFVPKNVGSCLVICPRVLLLAGKTFYSLHTDQCVQLTGIVGATDKSAGHG